MTQDKLKKIIKCPICKEQIEVIAVLPIIKDVPCMKCQLKAKNGK